MAGRRKEKEREILYVFATVLVPSQHNAMGLCCAHFVCGSSTMNPARQETWSFMKNSIILLLVFALSIMSTNIDPGVLLFAWH